ncbi:ComEC/Rec2 family competence protein, partial [Flavobacterium jejuense]
MKWFQDVTFGIVSYLLMICFGALSHYFHIDTHYKKHYSNVIQIDNSIIVGSISTVLKPSTKFKKYIFEVSQCNLESSFGKILLYQSNTNQALQVGQKIVIHKPILPTLKATNPYQFDYSEYLQKQNIYHQVFCKEGDIQRIGTIKNFDYYLQKIRDKLSFSFDYHHFDTSTKSIIDALLFGQRNFIDKETITNYSKSGVVHILAISGLHIGILYLFLAFVLKPIDKFKYGKGVRLLLILGLLWIFALVTGLPASVTRAVTLFSFISFGNYFNQQTNIFNAVAISALVLLIFNPNFIFDVGFQLSYAAVISILLFQPYYEKFYFTKNRVGVYFIDIVLVSLAAQIGVLPLSLYYFHQLPLLFLLANIIVIPIASLVLIFGSITLVLNFIFKPFALVLGKFLSFIIHLMNEYIALIAKIEDGIIQNISFTSSMTILSYLVLLSFIYWIYKLKWFAFRNAMIVLMLLQIAIIYTKWDNNKVEELVIFNSKQTLIGAKKGNQIQLFSHDSVGNKDLILDYSRGLHCSNSKFMPLKNVLCFQGKRILIVDSSSVYVNNEKPDLVLLSQSPKLNLVR